MYFVTYSFFLNYRPHSLLALFLSYGFVASDQVEGIADKLIWREELTFF
jgi:hypothetical protein